MRRTAAAAVVAATAIAGCGQASLSVLQLRGDATRVCTATDTRARQIPTPRAPSGGATFLARGISLFAAERSALLLLHPPASLAGDYGRAMEAFTDEFAELGRARARLAGGADPVTAIRTLQRRLAPIEQREDAAWRALGIPSCVSR